ncbi:MAG: tRNA (N(6)-L-threonylcarbamoyladenosine(37)-C(2))-methylthiotransferase MtaB, partial [Oscillospiraceae bacterium]|nr:tRNA (N(6)-L-threonylcarbamoyladenosine(37)-C(2))-methylthiotransferase MtaB [Oscillospiraceae bacterium]
SCTVTNMSDRKTRQMINRQKFFNKKAIIAVVGCYPQVSKEEVSSIPGIDIILGSRNKGDIVYYVNRVLETGEKIVAVSDVIKNKNFEDLSVENYEDRRSRAFIKIQDGCNKFCSYCTIPFARGAVCSKPKESVLKEVRNLAKNGFKEIVLSGIHTASYGLDFNDKDYGLIDLIEDLNGIDYIERIRIGSLDPGFFKDEIIERISKIDKLCPHFHLSLQSGCDETLKRMNRKYTTYDYRDVLLKLRKKIKDVSITTDIIVGFPGETDEEFKETYDFLKEIKLTKTHIFRFSPREGTKAYSMEGQIHDKIKDERYKFLFNLNSINEKEFKDRYVGKILKVLIEDGSSCSAGYSENYLYVLILGEKLEKGNIYDVLIKKNKANDLIGKTV